MGPLLDDDKHGERRVESLAFLDERIIWCMWQYRYRAGNTSFSLQFPTGIRLQIVCLLREIYSNIIRRDN